MSQSAASAGAAGLTEGTLLGERFEIGEPLGAGAMGAVFRADDHAAGHPAAVKVLHKHLVTSREYVSRFKREAHAASRFRHEAAVRVLGTGETDDGRPYIAMELIEGRSLREVMDAAGRLELGRACNLAQQLLSALGAAHRRGIVHRDMKPDNIRVIVDEDGIERPKILDFGVAKFIGGDPGELEGAVKTKTGIVLGTPKYMSPEQIRGDAIDGRADIYAVGAILYEMLTGSPPFQADDVFGFVAMHLKEEVPPITQRFPDLGVPHTLDELILHMLEKAPPGRPSDAGALSQQIQRWAVEDPNAVAKTRALHLGSAAALAAGVAAAVGAHFLTPQIDVAVGAAGVGLGVGTAAAARLQPRPSVGGYARRIGIVAGALAVIGVISLFVPSTPGHFMTAGHGLAALLAYAAYLLVWNSRWIWLRPLVAGLAAPLLAALLMPVRVASPTSEKFVSFLGAAAEGGELIQDARAANVQALLLVALLFGLASLVLPRPSAARL